MKAARLVILCAILFGLACSASARLGETVYGIQARYGPPLPGTVYDDAPSTRSHKKMGASDSIRSAMYEKDAVRITVEFSQGRSVKETYRKTKGEKLVSEDVEKLLQANSDGKKWTPVSSDTVSGATKEWKREDGARAYTSGYSLTVSANPKGF
jgi:hypothetical protein